MHTSSKCRKSSAMKTCLHHTVPKHPPHIKALPSFLPKEPDGIPSPPPSTATLLFASSVIADLANPQFFPGPAFCQGSFRRNGASSSSSSSASYSKKHAGYRPKLPSLWRSSSREPNEVRGPGVVAAVLGGVSAVPSDQRERWAWRSSRVEERVLLLGVAVERDREAAGEEVVRCRVGVIMGISLTRGRW